MLIQIQINLGVPPPPTIVPIPILEVKNSLAKIVFYTIVNYFCEVDFEYISESPQQIGFMAFTYNFCAWPTT